MKTTDSMLMGDPHFHKGVPIITVIMGIWGPQNNSKIRIRVPIIPGKWEPGVPVLGGPHFYLTPAPEAGTSPSLHMQGPNQNCQANQAINASAATTSRTQHPSRTLGRATPFLCMHTSRGRHSLASNMPIL